MMTAKIRKGQICPTEMGNLIASRNPSMVLANSVLPTTLGCLLSTGWRPDKMFAAYPGNQYEVISCTSISAALVAGLIHSKAGVPSAIRNESFNGITYPFAVR